MSFSSQLSYKKETDDIQPLTLGQCWEDTEEVGKADRTVKGDRAYSTLTVAI